MTGVLLLAVAILAFANGANDNFKGVATLWGSGRASYRRALCITEPARIVTAGEAVALASALPGVRWAVAQECDAGSVAARWSLTDALHWFSGAAISFARGLNDTPKIAALLAVASAGAMTLSCGTVAAAMALGGLLGAARVAHTISREITPMAPPEGAAANLVAAALVTLAAGLALPVSTTQVTTGCLFGLGWRHRKEADWARVREIILAWLATAPVGVALGVVFYGALGR
jgi:PiT family inorganic phosphate transporter